MIIFTDNKKYNFIQARFHDHIEINQWTYTEGEKKCNIYQPDKKYWPSWATGNGEVKLEKKVLSQYQTNLAKVFCAKCGKHYDLSEGLIPVDENAVNKMKAENGSNWTMCSGKKSFSTIVKANNREGYFLKCPHCSNITSTQQCKSLSKSQKENLIPKKIEIYDDDDRIAITVALVELIGTKQDNIIANLINCKYVYNTKTGYSYIIGARKNKKAIKGVQPIQNATYKGIGRTKTIYDEIAINNIDMAKAIYDKLRNIYGREDEWDEIKNFAGSNIQKLYRAISFINRFPKVSFKALKSAVLKLTWGMADIAGHIPHDATEAEFFDMINKKAKLNTKSEKRMVRENIHYVNYIKVFRRMFKKIALLPRFCEIYEVIQPEYYENQNTLAEITNLIKRFISIKGETNTIIFLESEKHKNKNENISFESLLKDTAYMYDKIKKEIKIADAEFTGSLREIHDNFSKTYDKIRRENKIIPYSKEENMLEEVINGYEFRLPVDTHTLIDVGNYMHICVGSYDTKAINKICTIVVVYKNGTPEICIELNSNQELVQAKTKYNNRAYDEKAEVLRTWVENHNINPEKSYDYVHIAKGMINSQN